MEQHGQAYSNNVFSPQKSENFLWVSLCAYESRLENNFIKIGHGYMMETNLLAHFYSSTEDELKWLQSTSIYDVEFNPLGNQDPVIEKICLIKPFLKDLSPLVVDSEVSIKDLNEGIISVSDLPQEAQQLYSQIKHIFLSHTEFQAIEHSINTIGCKLKDKLDEKIKKAGFGRPENTYIRIPLGQNYGQQPGQPFVLEIWPKGHSSPIHNHGNAVAIIKLLYGELDVDLHNPLANKNNPDDPKPVKSIHLTSGDITWMTPLYYQTHRLKNTGQCTAISIQAYSDSDTNTGGESQETFDYILAGDQDLHHFRPNADLEFNDYMAILLNEYRDSIKDQVNN